VGTDDGVACARGARIADTAVAGAAAVLVGASGEGDAGAAVGAAHAAASPPNANKQSINKKE